jgi:hypothetical protein
MAKIISLINIGEIIGASYERKLSSKKMAAMAKENIVIGRNGCKPAISLAKKA